MSKRHRRHSTAGKREIVETYLNGEALHVLGKRHDVCRCLFRIWIEKYERVENVDLNILNAIPQYDECRGQGMQVGSGVVEGGCRQYGLRLK